MYSFIPFSSFVSLSAGNACSSLETYTVDLLIMLSPIKAPFARLTLNLGNLDGTTKLRYFLITSLGFIKLSGDSNSFPLSFFISEKLLLMVIDTSGKYVNYHVSIVALCLFSLISTWYALKCTIHLKQKQYSYTSFSYLSTGHT